MEPTDKSKQPPIRATVIPVDMMNRMEAFSNILAKAAVDLKVGARIQIAAYIRTRASMGLKISLNWRMNCDCLGLT